MNDNEKEKTRLNTSSSDTSSSAVSNVSSNISPNVSSLAVIDTDINQCTICQRKFHFNEIAVKTNCLPYSHHFHKDCLWLWCKEHNSCPVCKEEIVRR
jgi:hypothetical protein